MLHILLRMCSVWGMTKHARWDVMNDRKVPAGLVSGADWHRIEDATGHPTTGESVPPFYVRVGTAPDGRMIVTGLLLAEPAADALEVTANVLRAVSLAEVIRTIQWHDSGTKPPRSAGPLGPTGLARFEGHEVQVRAAAGSGESAPRKGRTPTEDDLLKVVATYREHAWARDAIARTARALSVSRYTVQRHLDRAQEAGLFPEGRRVTQRKDEA